MPKLVNLDLATTEWAIANLKHKYDTTYVRTLTPQQAYLHEEFYCTKKSWFGDKEIIIFTSSNIGKNELAEFLDTTLQFEGNIYSFVGIGADYETDRWYDGSITNYLAISFYK